MSEESKMYYHLARQVDETEIGQEKETAKDLSYYWQGVISRTENNYIYVMCDFYHWTSPSKSSGFRLRRILSHTQIEWVSILVVHRLCKCHASRTLMVYVEALYQLGIDGFDTSSEP